MHYKAGLRHMSLAVTEVMLTMGRWLKGGLEGVYCIVTKGKQFREFKFHLQGRGGNVETVVGGLPKA